MNRDHRQRLLNGHLLVRTLANRSGAETESRSRIPRRAGAVRDAVLRALAEANKPLWAREIHAAAQTLASEPLSWNTVKDRLHKNARRPDSPIERVGHGRYRHR